jgi:hypothetical protein
MSFDRRRPRTAGKPGERRRNRIAGQWAPRLVELLDSPAWRVMSLSAHRVVDRIDIELRHHGGTENGNLIVTFDQFQQYGIHRHSIAPALREVEALGIVAVTQRGRGGNREYRLPHRFRLTYQPTDHAEPTHEWRRLSTMAEAEAVAQMARMARKASKRARVAPKTKLNRKPVTENAKFR